MRPTWKECVCVILFLGLMTGGQAHPEQYPHQPSRWVLQSLGDSAEHQKDIRIIKEATTTEGPTWLLSLADLFPKLYPCKPGHLPVWPVYLCPAVNPGKGWCNYHGYGYCGYWGCETVVVHWSRSWTPQQPDEFLKLVAMPIGCEWYGGQSAYVPAPGRNRWCNAFLMTVLQPNHPSWLSGKVWTVMTYQKPPASRAPFLNIQIVKRQPQALQVFGPNLAMNEATQMSIEGRSKALSKSAASIPFSYPKAPSPKPDLTTNEPLFKVLEATYDSLNRSNPNFTESCWLCYDARPPFYEGVAVEAPFQYSAGASPPQCKWDTPRRGVTLNQVSGRGTCFGNSTLAKQLGDVCSNVIGLQNGSRWAMPATSGMWICHQTGVSPCVYLPKFNISSDFCVQVVIVPKILYHAEGDMYRSLEELNPQLHKRELVTAISVAMLFGLGAAGVGTGISALVTSEQGLSHLQATIDEDLQRVERSISYLEKSLSSLSEVVLQNRRGLDLLFMQEGGLCAALKEECCFYADHTGVVRDSMAELRDRLAKRQKEREA